ncbi:unnamed protein product [Effrenium voratum]|nr:unnamed protein product [Effrenium voratum]
MATADSVLKDAIGEIRPYNYEDPNTHVAIRRTAAAAVARVPSFLTHAQPETTRSAHGRTFRQWHCLRVRQERNIVGSKQKRVWRNASSCHDFCGRIGPMSRCFCGHDYGAHAWSKGRKELRPACSSCHCKGFRYMPRRPEEIGEWWLPRRKGFDVRIWRAKCKCHHSHEESMTPARSLADAAPAIPLAPPGNASPARASGRTMNLCGRTRRSGASWVSQLARPSCRWPPRLMSSRWSSTPLRS